MGRQSVNCAQIFGAATDYVQIEERADVLRNDCEWLLWLKMAPTSVVHVSVDQEDLGLSEVASTIAQIFLMFPQQLNILPLDNCLTHLNACMSYAESAKKLKERNLYDILMPILGRFWIARSWPRNRRRPAPGARARFHT